VVIGAAVLLFIASFLDLSSSNCSGAFCPALDLPNAWDSVSVLMSVYLAGVIGAAVVVVSRALPQPRKVAGLELTQFGVALTIFAAWTAFWWMIDLSSAGAGLILGLISTLVLAGAAVATPLVPALKEGLIPAPKPPVISPYGAPQPGAGYGYPGGGATAQPQPQPWNTQGGGQPFAAQQAAPAPADVQQPGAAAAPVDSAAAGAAGAEFAPFWFAVPMPRPLFSEDGSPTPIAELAPGTWYLAVDQRGPSLIAQTQDGRRGVLQDSTGIQRG
jgi:hypothetical protein